jgi:hypothetical protein
MHTVTGKIKGHLSGEDRRILSNQFAEQFERFAGEFSL